MLLVAESDPAPRPATLADHHLLVHQMELNNPQSEPKASSCKTGCIFKARKQTKLLPAP